MIDPDFRINEAATGLKWEVITTQYSKARTGSFFRTKTLFANSSVSETWNLHNWHQISGNWERFSMKFRQPLQTRSLLFHRIISVKIGDGWRVYWRLVLHEISKELLDTISMVDQIRVAGNWELLIFLYLNEYGTRGYRKHTLTKIDGWLHTVKGK